MSYRVSNAEELLREIATDLIRVPVDERTRLLHLKALSLKRVVMGWSLEPPPEEKLEAMLETLHALRIEVLDLRGTLQVPSSQVRLRSTRGAIPARLEEELRRRAKG